MQWCAPPMVLKLPSLIWNCAARENFLAPARPACQIFAWRTYCAIATCWSMPSAKPRAWLRARAPIFPPTKSAVPLRTFVGTGSVATGWSRWAKFIRKKAQCILMYTCEYMSSSTILTVRIEANAKRELEKLARSTQRSKSFLAAEAIRDYIAINQWQIEETKKALAEADRGDFASAPQVKNVMRKWTKPRAR